MNFKYKLHYVTKHYYNVIVINISPKGVCKLECSFLKHYCISFLNNL